MGMIEDEAEKLKNSRLHEERVSSGRAASTAGLGRRFGGLNKAALHLRQKSSLSPTVDPAIKEKEVSSKPIPKVQPQTSSFSPDAPLPIPSVEHPRGTILDVRETGGISNHGYEQRPVVKHTTGVTSSDKKLKVELPVVRNTTGGIPNLGYENLPVVESTTGGISDHGAQSRTLENREDKSKALVSDDRMNLSQNLRPKDKPQQEAPLAVRREVFAPVEPVLDDAPRGIKYHGDIQGTSSDSEINEGRVSTPVVEDTTRGKLNHGVALSNPEVPTTGGISDHGFIEDPVVKNTTGVTSNPDMQTSRPPRGIKYHGGMAQEIPSPKPVTVHPVVENTTGGIDPRLEKTPLRSARQLSLDEDTFPNQPLEEPLSFFSDEFIERKREPMQVLPQNGDLMIPHELFQAIVVSIRRVHDRDVYCCLLRYSYGFHRDWCEAGLSYITKWTNISDKSNVAKALKRLVERGLIEILQDPDYKANRGTVYKLPLLTNYLKKKGKTPEPFMAKGLKERVVPPVVAPTTGGSFDPGLEKPPTGSIENYPPVVQPTTNKETLKEKNKELSLTSEILQRYLTEILTKGQRDTEREFLLKLLEEGIQETVLEKSLLELKSKGVPPRGEPCLMPMKWLYTSGSGILKKFTPSQAHQSPSEPPGMASTPRALDEDHPSWSQFQKWRGELTDEVIVACLVAKAIKPSQAENLVDEMKKDKTKSYVVESCLRGFYANQEGLY